MIVGFVVINTVKCFISIDKEKYYAQIIPNDKYQIDKVKSVFYSENKRACLPFLIGKTNSNVFFYISNCYGFDNEYFIYFNGSISIQFDKLFLLYSNVAHNIKLDSIDIPVDCMHIGGKNIDTFIGSKFDNTFLENRNADFELNYKGKLLEISLSILDLHSSEIKVKEKLRVKETQYLLFKIKNGVFSDYLYLLELIDFVLRLCCFTDKCLLSDVSFSITMKLSSEQEKKFRLYQETYKSNFIDFNAIDAITLYDMTLLDFVKLISEIHKRKEQNILHSDFIKYLNYKVLNFDSYVSIVRTFENEFDNAYPKFRVKEGVKNFLIDIILNGYNKEKLNGIITEKEYKKLAESYIRFLSLRTSRLEEKIVYMLENYNCLLPQNVVESLAIREKKNLNKLCTAFVEKRNEISHGKEFNVIFCKEDYIIFECLILFIYYFFLEDINLSDERKNAIFSNFILRFKELKKPIENISERDWVDKYNNSLNLFNEI